MTAPATTTVPVCHATHTTTRAPRTMHTTNHAVFDHKAMIFAAGRGERMRPLTDACPKPLLRAGGKALIEWQIERLAAAGFTTIVINHAWLGAQFQAALGDGTRWGVQLRYSPEDESHALETAGGIAHARALLETAGQPTVFVAVSGDVYTDFDYAQLIARATALAAQPEPGMHLVMVPNPPFHPDGDFALVEANGITRATDAVDMTDTAYAAYATRGADTVNAAPNAKSATNTTNATHPAPHDAAHGVASHAASRVDRVDSHAPSAARHVPPHGPAHVPSHAPFSQIASASPLPHGPSHAPHTASGLLSLDGAPRYTFGNIGLYDTRMFYDLPRGTRRALTPYYRDAIAQGRASGELYAGRWENVGTPMQLAALDAEITRAKLPRARHS